MAQKVIMPKQGLQMTEGTITKWLVHEGDSVRQEQPLFEMETDKLAITIDSPFEGILLRIVRKEWETVPITQTIAIVGEAGEDITDLLTEVAKEKDSQSTEHFPAAGSTDQKIERPSESAGSSDPIPSLTRSGRILISPWAKKLAEDHDLDYTEMIGSGKEGMIVEKDLIPLLSIKATGLARKLAGPDLYKGIQGTGPGGRIRRSDLGSSIPVQEDTIVPIAGMRRAICDHMMASLHEMAQANHKIRVDMSESVKIRAAFKSRDESVSYNDIVICAVVRALVEMPYMNALSDGSFIYQKHYVNMGVAVATEKGLIVPTLRNADRMSLSEIHEETAKLADRAKNGGLIPADYSDGTFTITNLGMFGLDEFTAIINPPQVGILAVGSIVEMPVVEKGTVVIRPMVTLTLTYDHRVVDGAPAAIFLRRIRELLENPYLYLI